MGQGTRQPCDLFLKYILYSVCFIAVPPLLPVCLCSEQGLRAGGDYLSQWRSTMVSPRTKWRSFSVFFSLHSCYQRLAFFFFITIDVVTTKVKCWSFDNWLITNVPLKLLDCMCGTHTKIIQYLVSIANQYVMHILQLSFLSN